MFCGVAVHDGDDKDGWLDSKFSALNSLPMNLKLRAIICVMVFLVEVFFVLSDVLLQETVKTFDDTVSVSLVDFMAGLLGKDKGLHPVLEAVSLHLPAVGVHLCSDHLPDR